MSHTFCSCFTYIISFNGFNTLVGKYCHPSFRAEENKGSDNYVPWQVTQWGNKECDSLFYSLLYSLFYAFSIRQLRDFDVADWLAKQ